MTRESILSELPPFENRKVLIKKNQSVADIMAETLAAHDAFSEDYDLIAYKFLASSDVETLRKVFNFLKQYVRYKEEPTREQQTKSPAAIIETGVCDCKCYALFIGGIIDALNRDGAGIEWNYAYASYTRGVKTPAHVFVQAVIDGGEYWIDPVLSEFNQRYPAPVYVIKKQKVNDMSLYRLAGAPKSDYRGSVNVQQREDPLSALGAEVQVSPGNPIEWIKQNPLIAVGAAVALYLLLKPKSRR